MTRLCLSTLLLISCALALQIVLDIDQDQSPHNCEGSHTDSTAFDLMKGENGMSDHSACEGPSYVNPKNGMSSCCSAKTFWTTDTNHPTEGKCCPAGTSYSFDPSIQNGDCCLPSQHFLNTACRSISEQARSLQTAGGGCSSCGNGNVCSYGSLGILYNHCYTMKDSGGNELRRSGIYYINQDIAVWGERGIPFRICASSTNCSVNANQNVTEGGAWFQLDEQGLSSDTTNSPGWMSFLLNVYYIVVTPISETPYVIANFTGKGTCIFGECAICIKFGSATGSSGYLGLSSYTGGAGGGPYAVQNSRQCKPFYYEETTCIGPSNVAPN